MLNDELNKQLPSSQRYNDILKSYKFISEKPKANQASSENDSTAKREYFPTNLKTITRANILKTPPIHNLIMNPAEIFNFRRQPLDRENDPLPAKKENGPIESLSLTLRKTESAFSEALMRESSKEINSITKKIAVDRLIEMFVFSEAEPHIMKSETKFNLMQYRIIEKLAEEKWVQFLEKKKIKLNDVRVLIGFYKGDRIAVEDINKIVEKVIKVFKVQINK